MCFSRFWPDLLSCGPWWYLHAIEHRGGISFLQVALTSFDIVLYQSLLPVQCDIRLFFNLSCCIVCKAFPLWFCIPGTLIRPIRLRSFILCQALNSTSVFRDNNQQFISVIKPSSPLMIIKIGVFHGPFTTRRYFLERDLPEGIFYLYIFFLSQSPCGETEYRTKRGRITAVIVGRFPVEPPLRAASNRRAFFLSSRGRSSECVAKIEGIASRRYFSSSILERGGVARTSASWAGSLIMARCCQPTLAVWHTPACPDLSFLMRRSASLPTNLSAWIISCFGLETAADSNEIRLFSSRFPSPNEIPTTQQ